MFKTFLEKGYGQNLTIFITQKMIGKANILEMNMMAKPIFLN